MGSYDNGSITSVIGTSERVHKELIKVPFGQLTIIPPTLVRGASMTDIEGTPITHLLQRVGRP